VVIAPVRRGDGDDGSSVLGYGVVGDRDVEASLVGAGPEHAGVTEVGVEGAFL
jgi:hypothetical protein